MTNERMSPDEALDFLARRAARTPALEEGEVFAIGVLLAYLADTQEIVRLARKVVEADGVCRDILRGKVAGAGPTHLIDAKKERGAKIDALRDRLEKHKET